MDLFLLLKFVHVMGAILWVGGASILTLLCAMLDRRGDDAATLTGVSYVALLGNRVFVPVGLLVIVTGLTLAWLGGFGFATWAIFAVAIVASTFTLGATVLGPSCERCVKTWNETGDLGTSIALGRRVLRLVKLDLAGQFAIISLMVLKPELNDPLMLVPLGLLALGGLLFALGAPRAQAPLAA